MGNLRRSTSLVNGLVDALAYVGADGESAAIARSSKESSRHRDLPPWLRRTFRPEEVRHTGAENQPSSRPRDRNSFGSRNRFLIDPDAIGSDALAVNEKEPVIARDDPARSGVG